MCLAIPGKVVGIVEENGLRIGRVDFGGVIKRVCLDFVPELEVGNYTIVHVGFALSKIDEDEALRTLEVFRQMGVLEEELAEARGLCPRRCCAQSPCPDGSCAPTCAVSEVLK